MKRLLFPAILVVVMPFVLGACSSPAAPAPAPTAAPAAPAKAASPAAAAPKTLLIGEVETLTGASSENLKLAAGGNYLAKTYINNHGGITVGGQVYMLDVALEDNKGNADGASAAANKLINQTGVKFITGSGPPPQTNAIGAVAEPTGTLYAAMYNNGSKDEMNPNRKFTFVTNNDSFAGQIVALTYLKKIHPEVKNFAYILIDDGQIKDNTPQVTATAKSLGLEMVGDIIGFSPDTVDFTPIAQKAVSRNADAIMLGNGPTDYLGQTLKGLRTMGYSKPVFQSTLTPIQDVIKIAGADAATNFFSIAISADITIPGILPVSKEVVDMAKKEFGRFDYGTAMGFNPIYTTVQAIQKAQSLDPKAVAAAWESMDTIETLWGPGKMGGLKTYGIKHSVYANKVPILRVEKNEISWGDWGEGYVP